MHATALPLDQAHADAEDDAYLRPLHVLGTGEPLDGAKGTRYSKGKDIKKKRHWRHRRFEESWLRIFQRAAAERAGATWLCFTGSHDFSE